MATAKAKKCYYEVLGIERDATDDEIKKAYRKLALQLHPDKNPDRVDEAKEEFQKLQQAHEVLSNPQERAWYDKHRDAVLREGFEQDDDVIVDLFPYFTSSCFSGFGDDDKGFYTVYRGVFDLITNEEIDAGCEEDIPSFGDSLSTYEDTVGTFYGYWEAYCTSKSFMWKDEYDSRRAGNRMVARMMERENEKVRKEAKKAWNQQVRALVDFVKRRDKRVQEWRAKQDELRKEKQAAAAKKMQEEKAKKLAERKKTFESLKKQREKEQQNINKHLKEMADIYGEGDSNEESDEEEISCLYCAACNKSFRTEKAFANHEKSKKHLAEVERLREEMEEDDLLVDEDDEENDLEEEEVDAELTGSAAEEANESDQAEENANNGDVEDGSDTEVTDGMNNLNVGESETKDSDNDEEVDMTAFVASKTKKGKGKAKFQTVHESDHDEDVATVNPEPSSHLDTSEANQEEDASKTSKKKRRRAKKGAAGETPSQSEKSKDNGEKARVETETEVNIPSKCMVCNTFFPSRSKLFNHIKTTGHAVPLSNAQANAKCNESGKGGKKKKGRGRE